MTAADPIDWTPIPDTDAAIRDWEASKAFWARVRPHAPLEDPANIEHLASQDEES